MSVQQYWAERLVAKRPLRSESLWVPRVNYRGIDGIIETWPRAVNRTALYNDYVEWHLDSIAAAYSNVGYFQDNPHLVPEPLNEQGFYHAIGQWLYIFGKDQQVRAYMVPHRLFHDGKWRDCRKRHYFVRLGQWEEHVAAFELHTGSELNMGSSWGVNSEQRVQRALKIAEARQAFLKRIDENREALPKALRG